MTSSEPGDSRRYPRVFPVPPVPRRTDARRTLDLDEAERVATHVAHGGITRFLYGGAAQAPGLTLPGASSIPAADSVLFLQDAGTQVELDVRDGASPCGCRTRSSAGAGSPGSRAEVDYPRGFRRLYAGHVRPLDKGCDFDFLEGTARVPEPQIH